MPSIDPRYTLGEEDNKSPKKVSYTRPLTNFINYLEVFMAPIEKKGASCFSIRAIEV